MRIAAGSSSPSGRAAGRRVIHPLAMTLCFVVFAPVLAAPRARIHRLCDKIMRGGWRSHRLSSASCSVYRCRGRHDSAGGSSASACRSGSSCWRRVIVSRRSKTEACSCRSECDRENAAAYQHSSLEASACSAQCRAPRCASHESTRPTLRHTYRIARHGAASPSFTRGCSRHCCDACYHVGALSRARRCCDACCHVGALARARARRCVTTLRGFSTSYAAR